MEWLVLGGIAFFTVFFFIFPSWRRWEIAREQSRNPRKVPVGGLIAPFDEVFHPSAYEANLVWQAEQEIPAPAPDSDDTRPDLASGRIRIVVDPSRGA